VFLRVLIATYLPGVKYCSINNRNRRILVATTTSYKLVPHRHIGLAPNVCH
jgi:hypothetical protein